MAWRGTPWYFLLGFWFLGLRFEGSKGRYHDRGDAAHEHQSAPGLHVLAGLLSHKELTLNVDGKDVVDLGAGDLVEVAKVLDASVALASDGE